MAKTRRQRSKSTERKRAGSKQRDNKHRFGGDWTSIALPDGVELFQPKEGKYILDIVPYEVGEGNPFADESGTWYYERTYWVHRGVGPNNESHTCAYKHNGSPCPVCDMRSRMANDPDTDEDVLKNLRPKERQLWLIYDRNAVEKAVQLWEFSHYNFGRLLDERRQDADEDEEHIKDFDDMEGGSTLKVSFGEKTGGGYRYLETRSIDFRPRKNGLSDEVLEHGICLDDLIKITPYDDLKKILLQIDDDSDEDTSEEKEKTTTKKKSAKKKKKDLPTAESCGIKTGDVVIYEDEEHTIEKVSRDGTSLTLTDEDGEIVRAVSPKDVTKIPQSSNDDNDDDDDDDVVSSEDDTVAKEEKKPRKSSTKKTTKKVEEENDDDDDDDDDEGWGDFDDDDDD